MRARRAMPLTVRVALTYALLVGATLLVVVGLTAHLTRLHLAGALDRRLLATVESFQAGPGRRVERPADLAGQARRWLAVSAFPAEELVAVRTAAGDVLTIAGGVDLGDVPGSEGLLQATESGWWTLEGQGGPYRVVTVPLILDGRQEGTLVVGASRERDEAILAAILSGVGIASAVGVAFATVLGVLAVRRTLRPLRRMSREVEAIEATGDLSVRVGHEGPADEVGVLAQTFDRMLDRLQESFESQRRFLADASHELRTPIQVVRGQLELLQEDLRGTDATSRLAITLEELERMRRIVNDLLLLARLDEGMPVPREPVEVELVLGEALLRGMLLGSREARVDVEPDLYAMANAERLLQVITNLVTNAVRHAGERATISLRGRREGGWVVVEVADTGAGIPPDELAHVFDRMYRGSAARSGEAGGAGLGLAIVASLTRAMGGEVAVDSMPGRGTTFTVRLPPVDAADTEPIVRVAS